VVRVNRCVQNKTAHSVPKIMQIDSGILTREQSNVVVHVATSLFGPPSTLDNCCKTSLIGLRRSGTRPLISPVCLSVSAVVSQSKCNWASLNLSLMLYASYGLQRKSTPCPKKWNHSICASNFAKCWPIFKILSLADLAVNF